MQFGIRWQDERDGVGDENPHLRVYAPLSIMSVGGGAGIVLVLVWCWCGAGVGVVTMVVVAEWWEDVNACVRCILARVPTRGWSVRSSE